MIRAVIFDLDDTLYPERQYTFSGYAAVADHFAGILGEPDAAAAEMRQLFDTPQRPRVFNALLASRGLADADLIRRMIDVFRAHPPAIRLFADADAALTRLRETHKLGLLTDGPAVQQWAKIDALALRPRLDQIVVTSECHPTGGDSPLDYGKPHHHAFELIAGRLGAASDQCAYVADNPAKDFVAPNRLGWLTIRVRRPGGIYWDTPCAPHGEPQWIMSTLDELNRALT